MYTIKTLADIAKVSTRTLRYYDSIQLLNPTMVNESGYRLYDDASIDLLQQIMFQKYLNIPLQEIKDIIYNDKFDKVQALS